MKLKKGIKDLVAEAEAVIETISLASISVIIIIIEQH